MTISNIARAINGKIRCGEDKLSANIDYAFASDLMSDVLTVQKENILLITGLANNQAIRTAEMSDVLCIVFARGKTVGDDIIELARESNIVIIESPYSCFKVSGELYKAGIKPLF